MQHRERSARGLREPRPPADRASFPTALLTQIVSGPQVAALGDVYRKHRLIAVLSMLAQVSGVFHTRVFRLPLLFPVLAPVALECRCVGLSWALDLHRLTAPRTSRRPGCSSAC